MSDVFISYASEDREIAQELASAIGATGRSVWWDRQILAGQVFDQVIEHELTSAKCVVVLWSKHSVVSEWVRNEAAAASERGVLIPALMDAVKPPLEFRRKQTADLVSWKGEASHRGFQSLCGGISSIIGGASPPQLPTSIGKRLHWKPRWALIAIAAIIVLGGGASLMILWRTAIPTSNKQAGLSDADSPIESKTTASQASSGSDGTPLSAPPRDFKMKAAYVGQIDMKFLKAVVKRFNSRVSELEVYFFVKTEQNRNHTFQPSAFSLRNGEEIIASDSVEPSYIDVGATATVLVTFLVPESWQRAELIVRHGVSTPFAEEAIALQLAR